MHPTKSVFVVEENPQANTPFQRPWKLSAGGPAGVASSAVRRDVDAASFRRLSGCGVPLHLRRA